MQKLVCPHCKSQRFSAARPPKDVVVVMPCPSCQEWVGLFRDRVIALNRRVIEHGTREERKAHLADIIEEFLDAQGLFGSSDDTPAASQPEAPRRRAPKPDRDAGDSTQHTPISEQEWERFLKVDLKCIDNPVYFRKHFG